MLPDPLPPRCGLLRSRVARFGGYDNSQPAFAGAGHAEFSAVIRRASVWGMMLAGMGAPWAEFRISNFEVERFD